MFGLLYKDLMVMKKDLIINVIGIVFFSIPLFISWGEGFEVGGSATETVNAQTLSFVIMPIFAYFAIFLMISMVQSSLFAQDERKVWASYITASPLGVKGQVLSKYYLTLALSFGGYVWGIICDFISSAVTGVQGSAMTIYTSMFFVQILLRAFEMPFLIRFGQKNGKIYKILMMVGVVFIGIVYALFGKLPEFASFDECLDAIIRVVNNPQSLSSVVLGIASIFPYAAIFCYYISYKISCKLYQKGVENYDA